MNKLIDSINYFENELLVYKMLTKKKFFYFLFWFIMSAIVANVFFGIYGILPSVKKFWIVLITIPVFAILERIISFFRKKVLFSYSEIPQNLKNSKLNFSIAQCYLFKEFLKKEGIFDEDSLIFIKEHIILKKRDFNLPSIGISAIYTSTIILLIKKVIESVPLTSASIICVLALLGSWMILKAIRDIEFLSQGKIIDMIETIDSLLFELKNKSDKKK